MASNGTIKNSYKTAKGRDPRYFVHISCAGMATEIIADMPAEFSTAVSSQWEPLLPSALGSLFGQSGENLAKAVAGSNFVQQDLSTQVWVNSSPIEVSVELEFDMGNGGNGFSSVVAPIRTLEMLCMPSKGAGNFLISPGPNRGRLLGGGADLSITLTIGQQFKMHNAILMSVQSTMSNRLDAGGYPVHGRCTCNFMSSIIPSREDWADWMGVSRI